MQEPVEVSIKDLGRIALAELEVLGTLEALEQWRVRYLGRRGELTTILRSLSSLSIEQRRALGAVANMEKSRLESKLEERTLWIREATRRRALADDRLDVTLPGRAQSSGRLHPTTQIIREIGDALGSLGFEHVEGPEVELDHYNFELLNIPKWHPARDMWSTFFIDEQDKHGEYPMLLRTHTSPMQARVMEVRKPPIRVFVPGKCYRYEATDATHEWHFFQVEGLVVDEGITFADLRGTIDQLARRLFGEERQSRFRPDYFPFVEPGVDVSIDCFACTGEGEDCRVCSGSRWIEIMGAGMVHPNVLKGVGYDPQKYTGFAFGMGVDRIAMLKYGIDDIRHFYANDLRFLAQF